MVSLASTTGETPCSVPLQGDGECMPHLQFSKDGKALFVHLLRPGRTVIGRSDRADLALPSDGVSRVHCAIEQPPEG